MKLIGQIALSVLIGLIGLVVLVLLLLWICTAFIPRGKTQEEDSRFYRFLLQHAVRIAVIGSRIELTVSGREKIDGLVARGQRFLLVGNHISNYDPIVTWYAFPKAELGFISKPENFKVPYFGKIARKCLCLPIDRRDAAKARPTVELAARYLREDKVSMGAYPEGTRCRQPEAGMLKFRNGVFKISEWADHAPIAIVAVENTNQVCRNFPWRRTEVRLTVLRVLEHEELTGLSTVQIGALVREELEKYLYPETVL